MQGARASDNGEVAFFLQIFNMFSQDTFSDTGMADDPGKAALLRLYFDDVETVLLLG